MAILIKRYANRKLYNTQTSRYITLKGIAELIEADESVQVIDNETGEDITSVALSQILVDSERSNRSVPGSLLSDLIHRGGDALYGALRKGVGEASESLEDLQRNVRRVIQAGDEESGKFGDWIAFGKPDVDRMVQNAVERVFRVLDLPRRSDVEALHAAAELLVLPTRYDAFANACLEAMASGLPVATTPSNGAAELIEPGVSGWIAERDFAPALRALDDPARLRAMGEAARRRAETFTWRSHADRVLELYARVRH